MASAAVMSSTSRFCSINTMQGGCTGLRSDQAAVPPSNQRVSCHCLSARIVSIGPAGDITWSDFSEHRFLTTP